MAIVPVPRQHFSTQRLLFQEDDPPTRTLRTILNEIIDAVNAGSVVGVDHLTVAITAVDWPSGALALGVCPLGRVAYATVVEVVTPFDGGAQLTVGDPSAQGRLLGTGGCLLSVAELYINEPHHHYGADQPLFVYFPAGTPSAGAGQVTVYLA